MSPVPDTIWRTIYCVYEVVAEVIQPHSFVADVEAVASGKNRQLIKLGNQRLKVVVVSFCNYPIA
jgi:hypothetical protein